MDKIDVHNYKGRLRLALNKLENSDLPGDAKKDIMDFYHYILDKGINVGRIAKYIYHLMQISKMLGKSFTETEKDDIIGIVNKIGEMNYAEYTKHDFNVIIKRFYKWLEGGDEDYPDKVRWITTTVKNDKGKLPEELLSKDEVMKLIKAADHLRDRAFISLLYESGCRIGEMLNIRIKHVNIDELGAQIIVDGKTGMRRIRVVASATYLTIWLEYHPLRDNPNAPLWPVIGTRNHNGYLNYSNANKMIKKVAEKAGIKKRVNPHIFRHSRATHMANYLTEAQMNHYFGWVQGSDMPSTYVHLSGRDLDGAILKIYGLKKDDEEEKREEFTPKKCQRCEKMNSPTGKICNRCGCPLDDETISKIEDQRKRMENLMANLLKDPEVRGIIANKMREMRNGGE
ncbi:MAG: tyrosine-type recombinase/integrase [Candidatus Aenigmarchaeota archaeon]|nr:tyrosine-type recombinase/integrase [Candidatus Aenigmarchaeota archaeon]